MLRQGDLLIEKIDKLPKGLKKVVGNVLMRGEVTGHTHRITKGDIYRDGVDLYLQVYAPAGIIHEEHNPIPIEIGTYKIRRQREYTPKRLRTVID